jgi:TolB protein
MKRLSLFAALLVIAPLAVAKIEITIVPGGTGAVPIAVVPFGTAPGLSLELASVVEADLVRSGFFSALPATDMLEHPNDASAVDYRNWRMVNVDDVIVGRVQRNATGALSVRFELLDVANQRALAGFELPIPDPAKPRPIAHQIADIIYEKLTGFKGYFNTQIAYVTSSGPTPRDRVYQLIVADTDGENPVVVVSSREPVMSPAWSPDGKRLAYVGYDHGNSAIYIHDLVSGQARKATSEKGINGAPAWSPDGRQLAITLSFGSNPDIYVIDLDSGARRRMTDSSAIDTEATWSPDGSQIAFTSDRGGQPQIYVVSSQGGSAERLTFEGKQNLRARYAPDGKSLLLVNLDESRYRIGLLDLQKRALQILSDGPLDESPSFAPNGRLIIYSTTGKQGAELATVTVDGRVRQRLKQVGDVREPAWSPFPR